MRRSLSVIEQAVPKCRRCPELRSYCTQIATEKRRAFADWQYWGKPVPSFGDRQAKMVIVGLAPAAHGANRTGRMFTGDRSGDFLFAALHRAGFANQPAAVRADDGLKLNGVYITAACRCAPPANKPTPSQLENCVPYLIEELAMLKPRVILCFGAIAWNAVLAALARGDHPIPRPRPKFTHAAEFRIADLTLLGCYHVSQQNTFTGRLTGDMIDRVLKRARQLTGRSAVDN